MDVTAIIVNYNTAHLLGEAIGALRASAHGLRLQTILVDNASRDGSPELIREQFADCEFIANPVNVGFGRANNQALPLVRGRYVLLLNTDAFVAPDTLGQTLAYMDANPTCGVLGVRLVGRDGALQPCCRFFPTPWNVFIGRIGIDRFFPRTRMIDDMAWDHASVRECDWVPGCYYLVRKDVIDAVGLFDPRYFLYFEEVDHCRAVKAGGWKVMFYPHTTVVHIGGESAKSDSALTSTSAQISELQVESEMLYFRRQYGRSGVWAALLLASIADLVLALKSILRDRSVAAVGGYAKHVLTSWSLFRRTAWATRATR
ncbi:MAG: glycosyltransferase family 2 protein [Rhizobacter sp.]|nr:glycosyltransferase family 2 protein [Rhizobacter sp.]